MTVLPEVVVTTTRQHADEKRQEVAQTHDEYGQNDDWSNNQEPVGVEEDWNPNQRVAGYYTNFIRNLILLN